MLEIVDDESVMRSVGAIQLECLSLFDDNATAAELIDGVLKARIPPREAVTLVTAQLAHRLAYAGQFDRANAVLDELAADDWAALAPDGDAFRTSELPLVAETIAVLDRADRAATLLPQLLPWRDHNFQLSIMLDYGPAELFIGRLERVLGQYDAARDDLEVALERTRRGNATFKTAEAGMELAQVLLACGERERAERLLDDAYEFAVAHNIRLFVRRIADIRGTHADA